jgi:hypothetical protein
MAQAITRRSLTKGIIFVTGGFIAFTLLLWLLDGSQCCNCFVESNPPERLGYLRCGMPAAFGPTVRFHVQRKWRRGNGSRAMRSCAFIRILFEQGQTNINQITAAHHGLTSISGTVSAGGWRQDLRATFPGCTTAAKGKAFIVF